MYGARSGRSRFDSRISSANLRRYTDSRYRRVRTEPTTPTMAKVARQIRSKTTHSGIARLRKIDDVVQHALVGQRLHANRGSLPRQAARKPVDHHLRVELGVLSRMQAEHVRHES